MRGCVARSGWKLLRLGEASSVVALRTGFLRRPDYDGRARGLVEVRAQA